MSQPRATLEGLGSSLPARDEDIDALDADARGPVAEVWLARAASELDAACSFAGISAVVLRTAGDGSAIQWLAARAVSDELRHAELCRAVASRYAGSSQPWPAPRAAEVARLEGVPPELAPTLRVLATCCVQETLGGAFLEHALAHVRAPTASAALRALLADEVDHGRVGWGHLAALDQDTRSALGAHLPAVLHACLETWDRRIAALPTRAYPEHGCPEPASTASVVRDALRDLVIPGLAHVGVDGEPAREWLATSPSANKKHERAALLSAK